MSGKIMGKVWDLDLPHNQLLVLLSLADHADHEGNNVFPSLGLTAWKTGYSEQQVRRVLRALEKAKILIVVERKVGKRTVYKIDLSAGKLKPDYVYTPYKKSEVSKSKGYQNDTPDPLHSDQSTPDILPEEIKGINRHKEPSLEPSKGISPFVEMKNAICKAFGWDKPTDTEWGQINKAASQLVKVDIVADDIASLYGYCKSQTKGNSFTPLFLASKASDWKKQRPARVVPDRPIEIVQPVFDDSPPPTPEQIEQYKADYLAMVASKSANSKPYNWRDYLPPGFNLDKEAV
jgi:hypothetical protein